MDPIDKPEKRWRLRKEPSADLLQSSRDPERENRQGNLLMVERDLRKQEERKLKVNPFWMKPVGPILWKLLVQPVHVKMQDLMKMMLRASLDKVVSRSDRRLR